MFLTFLPFVRQVVALYKEGHDGLGEEVLGSAAADRGSLGVRLLHVAVLRLTKHIYESEVRFCGTAVFYSGGYF